MTPAPAAVAADDRPAIDPDLQRALQAVAGELMSEAVKRVGDRETTEKMWIEDLRQYHGRYDEITESALKQGQDGSKLFFNRTRRKTRALAAKLKKMLFPADDANWSIEPTPNPGLAAEAEQAVDAALKARQAAKEGQQDAAQATALEQHRDQLSAVLDEAAARCDVMRRRIGDALTECRYDAAARACIDDAVKIGCGIIKGPVRSTMRRRGWKQVQPGVFEIEPAAPTKFEFRRVDPWNFFPDTNARTIEDSEGVYERHLMNKKQLRRLAREPGFDKAALRRVILAGPERSAPDYLAALRNITGNEVSVKDVFQVWEYSGPLEADKAATIAEALGGPEAAQEYEQADPLDEIHVVIWFCGAEVLKFGPYTLDSDEPIYSMFVLEPDEATVWGKGVPRIVRDSQSSINAGWRGMLDNGGYALGPHIIVNDNMIQPMDGDWSMKGPKLWRLKGTLAPNERAFDQFQVTMNQDQLAGIIALSERFMDEESGLPQIAMGDQTEATTKTVGGMALLMSQGAVTFEEIVKRFDDDFTVPNIRRAYDWEMQFGEDANAKGDFEVHARGASHLLIKEIEATNLLMIAQVYGPDDPDIKGDKLKRAVMRAMQLDPDEMIRSPAERQEWISQQQQGPTDAEVKMQEIDVRREEIEAKVAIAEMETERRLQEANIRHETQMMALAEQMNMKQEQLATMLKASREGLDSKERTLAAEIAMSERERQDAMAQGRDPMGSGGYVA